MSRFTQAQLYAPCSCGSGKKLKFCCANVVVSRHADDAVVQRAVALNEAGHPAAARALLEERVEARSSNPLVSSALARLMIVDGDDDAAVAVLRAAWERATPGPVGVGALLAHVLAARGDREAANAIADHVTRAPIGNAADLADVVAAFGVLGRDADIVAAVERVVPTSAALAVKAVALLNLGRLEAACEALRTLLSRASALMYEALLADLENGDIPVAAFGRLGVLPPERWLPAVDVDPILEADDPEVTRRAFRRFPIVRDLFRAIIDLDLDGRALGFARLAEIGAVDDLLTYAASEAGDDDDRLAAAALAVRHDLVGRDTPIRVRHGGRLYDVLMWSTDDGPDGEFVIPPEWGEAWFAALEQGLEPDPTDSTLPGMEELLARAPHHPVLRFNALARRMRALKVLAPPEEVAALQALVDEFPAYLHARAVLAIVLVQRGRIDEADAVLPASRLLQGAEPQWVGKALEARALIDGFLAARAPPDPSAG